MTRDYSKGKIYRLVCNITDQTYYGSTIQTLSQRLANHRNDQKEWLNGTGNYMTSFEILKGNDYNIIWIENYPCEDKEQLEARERYFIENNECVNKNIPNRTKKEYYEDNKEVLLEKQKQKYEENKEMFLSRRKEYRDQNKDKIYEINKQYRLNNHDKVVQKKKEYYQNNKETILSKNKEYRENHKEQKAIQDKTYAEKNKDKVREYKYKYYLEHFNDTYTCDCGVTLKKFSKPSHNKSKYHLQHCS